MDRVSLTSDRPDARYSRHSSPPLVTVLEEELKRHVTVDGVDFTVAIDPEGIRLTGKGKTKPEVELRWHDLLSGEAALAVALSASLSKKAPGATNRETEPPPVPTNKRVQKKRAR